MDEGEQVMAETPAEEWIDDEEDWDVEELAGNDLQKSLEAKAVSDLRKSATVRTAFDLLTTQRTYRDWAAIESSSRLGVYNGLSERTKRDHKKKDREREEKNAVIRQTYVQLLCSDFLYADTWFD